MKWCWHRWEKRPNELGCYGMGLETFEMRQCEKCHRWQDRLKGLKPDGRSRYPWTWTDRPAWRAMTADELASLPCVIDCRDGAVQSELDRAIQVARQHKEYRL